MVGAPTHYRVKREDNLYEIARRYDIGIVELLAANLGVDVWTPREGTELTLTTTHLLPPVREGLVLNLSELRLFYFAPGGTVMTFPIGIGREGWQTPLGKTTVINKRKNPPWIPPPSIREEDSDLPEVVYAGPDNPLGAYALYLGWRKFLIHGTNRPYGVGTRSSHGCIRLYSEDIEQLFNAVTVGTPVTVIDTPFKLGWHGNTLYLEVTPTQEQADVIAEYQRPHPLGVPEIYEAIERLAGSGADIDWYEVEMTVIRRDGIPTRVGAR